MKHSAPQRYLEPTDEAGRAFFSRPDDGAIVMLNLIRFREIADYRDTPDTPNLAPEVPISGHAAFQLYMDLTLPLLNRTGGDLLFYGAAGAFLIGPAEERWDAAMLVRQNSRSDFLAFASNPDYQGILSHRTAALEDSRLLPLFPAAARYQTIGDC